MKEELNRALALHKKGQINEAEKIYLDLLKLNPNNSSLTQLLGTLYLQKKNYDLSEKYLLSSLDLTPDDPILLNNLGLLKKQTHKIEKSIEYFSINIKKNNFLNSWINKSNILLETENYKEGLDFSKKAIKNYPNNLKIKNNLALFLFENGFKNQSIEIYKELDNTNNHTAETFLNYSNILMKTNKLFEAIDVLNKLLLEDKENLKALRQRALIYKELLDFKNAEKDLISAIKIDKFNTLSNKYLVDLYIDSKAYNKAIKHCDLMLENNIETDFFLIKKIFSNLNVGNWINLKDELEILNKKINDKNNYLDPLSIKYFNDDPEFQKKLTENYWNNKVKIKYINNVLLDNEKLKDNLKIRIGYFSADFNNHAVFHLIQDLFVNHDKSKFEIFAYSFLKEEGPSRDKVIKNVNKFTDIDQISDDEIIKLVQSDNLDVAIDLSGYTKNNKSYLFNHNISKIKINYLGYPGSMGTRNYDYILADKNIIPEEHLNYYSEKVIYMPEIYQPFTPKLFDMTNDRSEFNLPEKAFILGCFSRIEKILPNVFDIWMKILKKYKDIYLALCIKDKNVKNNINIYCEKNKFDFKRIIFLDPIDHNNNLRRISTFNLCLDTYPYNGHTGISDSLFQSCVPTISFTGNSFASRVSYSLLCSLELKQLISNNEEEYFNKIDYYCTNRNELKKIRDYLIKFKEKNFTRMVKFTKDFEDLITSVLLKYKKFKK